MKSKLFLGLFFASLSATMALAVSYPHKIDMNADWKFVRFTEDEPEHQAFTQVGFKDKAWDSVSLPHTAHIEPLVVNDQWQGICAYRKQFKLPAHAKGKRVILELEGAMSQSRIWLNGTLVKERMGGYLPVVVDITDQVKTRGNNTLAIRLDNRDNPLTGPKPLKRLDFNTYGGLYRNVTITLKNPVHISHPVLANKVGGGGIFVTTPRVSEAESTVQVKTHVVNRDESRQTAEVVHELTFNGKTVAQSSAPSVTIAAGQDAEIVQQLTVSDSKLWSPDSPNLYTVKTTLRVDGKVQSEHNTRIGLRTMIFKGTDLYLNGEKIYLRGTNRHQEYPFVGYAMSDNAQYRDAKKIKDAGFNHVRLSHYPHSNAFMDACDELGLITLNAIMGWQYYLDDDRFRDYCYRSATELLRRDRNRASIVAWEVSLNETKMPVFFMEELHRIVHTEIPGEHVYSAGWMDEVYDVYGQARQHRILHGYHPGDKPYFISEYGDWEYYSSNAGLNQDKLDKTRRYETSSRQLRAYGEKRLLQQAYNLQESHNDNLGTYAYGDGYWVMYDYNRGYHDEIESSGIMDIFRLPKFSYSFYASQVDPGIKTVLDIASFWTAESALDVKVYSNCDEVELFLNGTSLGKQKPDTDKNSTNLSHPPFTFNVDAFAAGTLKAVGSINGKQVATDMVQTPGNATELSLTLDESGKAPARGQNDTLFLYISAVDANGTVVPGFTGEVDLKIKGDVEVLNPGPVVAEAGIATALIRIGSKGGPVTASAKAGDLSSQALTFGVKR